jgi:hypothetical protein
MREEALHRAGKSEKWREVQGLRQWKMRHPGIVKMNFLRSSDEIHSP